MIIPGRIAEVRAAIATATAFHPISDATFADFVPLNSVAAPALPVHVLPEPMRSLVEHKAEATEAPPELSFVAAVGVVAAVVQTRFEVFVRDDYTEQLSVFCAGIAQPGERKTAQINEAIAPLIAWEIEERRRVTDENEVNARERRIVEARVKDAEKRAAAADNAVDRKRLVDEATKLQAEAPALRNPVRLMADDATPEQTGTLMGKNGGAIAIITDEGGAFLSSAAGRYSAGVAHIDHLLKGWSGSPVRIDRANGRNVLLDRAYCTVALMIQHELAQQMAENRDFMGRGLLDRFLWLMPLSRLGYRSLNPEPMPTWVSDNWRSCIRKLLAIPPALNPHEPDKTQPHRLSLDAEAERLRLEYACEVEAYMRPGHGYSHLRQYLGKWPGQVARLAGIFHCLEHANDGPQHAKITAATMSNAITLARCLLDHADATFTTMQRDPQTNRAMRMWEWVRRQESDTFMGSEAHQGVKRQTAFPHADAARDALRILVEHGYLALTREGKSEVYSVNPVAKKHSTCI